MKSEKGLIIMTMLIMIISCTTNKNIIPLTNAEWVTAPNIEDSNQENVWLAYSKDVNIEKNTSTHLIHIAADTKYWLWINDELIVREGGLKWGPDKDSFYEDQLDLGPHLRAGANTISIALWHFGKDGFSHKNGGVPALRISDNKGHFTTDATWSCEKIYTFISESKPPNPNWRLAESNINFDSSLRNIQDSSAPLFGYQLQEGTKAIISNIDKKSVKRKIPQWKDFGLQNYENEITFPYTSKGDTLKMILPYNMQVTPFFDISSSTGLNVDIRTDNYKGGSEYNVRTNYKTASGKQTFETPGWMNGHEVRYYFPAGITVNSLKYRETGYDTEFSGSFDSNDDALNVLWQKSARTLYITMRDNFMDCPDRERAQWWGDAVIQSGQCSYAFDRKSDLLTRKAILELMNWQKPDSTIYSPVPAGNWDKELPTQMLASVGFYGIWNYYQHTGDTETIKTIYPKIKSYLAIWNLNKEGLVIPRQGGWTWGDWGNEKDMDLIFNGWYALALKGAMLMAKELNDHPQQKEYATKLSNMKIAWNKEYWTGSNYRSPNYKGETDERGQALAVLAGFVDKTDYEAIKNTILLAEHCSPYFEKYVYEALFKMGYSTEALARMRTRYATMISSPITTLWEGWEVGSATWGGGTYNHSWSGGPLTIMSQYVLGVQPISPGYNSVKLQPQLGDLESVKGTVETPLGSLNVHVYRKDGKQIIDHSAPEGMKVIID